MLIVEVSIRDTEHLTLVATTRHGPRTGPGLNPNPGFTTLTFRALPDIAFSATAALVPRASPGEPATTGRRQVATTARAVQARPRHGLTVAEARLVALIARMLSSQPSTLPSLHAAPTARRREPGLSRSPAQYHRG